MIKKKEFIITIIIGLIVYYVIPLLSMLLDDIGIKTMLFLCLIIINPIYNFMYPFYYSLKRKFKFYIPLILATMFLPGVFIIYNSSALVYYFCYIVLGYIGAFIGSSLRVGIKKKV